MTNEGAGPILLDARVGCAKCGRFETLLDQAVIGLKCNNCGEGPVNIVWVARVETPEMEDNGF